MSILAHKIRLRLNQSQTAFLQQCAGTSRFVYNWALNAWNKQFEAGDKPNGNSLRKQLTAIKAVEFPWMQSISAAVATNAVMDLGVGFKNFFTNPTQFKHPAFKSRHKSKPSFNPWDGGRIAIQDKLLRVPNLGLVKLREPLRFAGRIISGTISREANQWYVSITVETEVQKPRISDISVGIDLGCKDLAVLSTGRKFEGAKPLKKLSEKLARNSRQLSRKIKGSANRAKAKLSLAALHKRIANVRKDYLHKLSAQIVLKFNKIVLEDLNIKGMVKLRSLARSVNDQSLGEFVRQLKYKAALYGSQVFQVDRFFPSSKTCSSCKTVKEDLTLSDRVYHCVNCSISVDRDINAALNLLNQLPLLEREVTPMESNPLGSQRSRKRMILNGGLSL